jgi:hypothetical protein
MSLTQNYQCPDCGATALSKTVECCDTCILKFYFDNPNSSNLADWHAPMWKPEDGECVNGHRCVDCDAEEEDN